jgi:prefoldin subunit 5
MGGGGRGGGGEQAVLGARGDVGREVEVEDGSIEKFRILETKIELLKKENDWLNVELDKKTQELQATHEDISSLKKEIREQLQEIRFLQLQEKKCKCGFRLEGKEEKESGICKFCKAKNE